MTWGSKTNGVRKYVPENAPSRKMSEPLQKSLWSAHSQFLVLEKTEQCHLRGKPLFGSGVVRDLSFFIPPMASAEEVSAFGSLKSNDKYRTSISGAIAPEVLFFIFLTQVEVSSLDCLEMSSSPLSSCISTTPPAEIVS